MVLLLEEQHNQLLKLFRAKNIMDIKSLHQLGFVAICVGFFQFDVHADIELNVNITGSGKVKIEENNQTCSESCQASISENTDVVLSYTTNNGSSFLGWGESSCDKGFGVILGDSAEYIGPSAASSKAMTFADFDGDQIDDVAHISLFRSKLTIQFNQGNGSYHAPVELDSMSYASSIDHFDWDSDGDQDIIAVDFNRALINIYLNHGNGEFSKSLPVVITSVKPYSIAVEDINLDGKPDLLVGSFNADINSPSLSTLVQTITDTELSWYLNDGDSNFVFDRLVTATGGMITVDTGDIDNDGDIDIVAAAITENKVIAYLNDQNVYQSVTIANVNSAYSVALGDIDNNGFSDVLMSSYYDRNILLSLQTGQGTFVSANVIKTFDSGVTSLGLSDIDNDGKLDIAWGLFDNGIYQWLRAFSYKDCIVHANENKTVTANFSQQNSGNVASSKGSGGSLDLLCIFLLGAFWRFRLV
jgi:hypothetical protein